MRKTPMRLSISEHHPNPDRFCLAADPGNVGAGDTGHRWVLPQFHDRTGGAPGWSFGWSPRSEWQTLNGSLPFTFQNECWDAIPLVSRRSARS